MIVCIKNLLKSTSLILVILSSSEAIAQEELPVPRSVIEWCLECQDAKKIFQRHLDYRDSIIANKNLTIASQATTIDNLNKTVENLIEERGVDEEIIANDDIIIGKYRKEVKKLKVNKWLERGVAGAIIAGIIILSN